MSDPAIKRGPSGEAPTLGYDPTTTHALLPLKVVSVTTDSITGQEYGTLDVNASFSASSLAINDANTPANTLLINNDGSINTNTTVTPVANQRVNAHSGDFVAGSIVDLATVAGAVSGGKLLTTETNSAGMKSDLDTIAGTVSGGKVLNTETNSAAMKTDLDTIAGAVSSSKMATKAASGDFADGAIITLGTQADAAWSLSGNATLEAIAKKIALLLNATLTVQQSDLSATGTISAAQPVINTPVSNATVQLAVGQGQSTWKAQLLAGGGGFTSGTTIVADKSPDGGTTWYSASFVVTGASPNTPASSVVGPGPLQLSGNVAGVTHVRIRCNVLNSTETIAVTLRASVGLAEVGLLAPLPVGSNLIGGVNVVDSAGTNKLAVDSSGRITGIIQAVAGTALAADQSNTELRTSLYGKNSAAGDTAVSVDSSGRLNVDIAAITAALTQANQVPVSSAAQQGALTLTVTSNSGTFTNNLDNTITFSGNATAARRIRIQNESSGVIYWETDATASTGSSSLAAPAANAVSVEWIAVQCTTLHIWVPSGGTTTLNGSGGVKVKAYA